MGCISLIDQFRPRTFDEVAGQDKAIAAIRRVLARGWGGRAWWITGASGQGKTTLAKIIAAEGAAELCVEDHEAAAVTPKLVRDLELVCSRRPLTIGGKAGWAFVINECHGLPAHGVRALLDALERIPSWATWIFTTTQKAQVSFFEGYAHVDAHPLVDRCQKITLEDGPATRAALAQRARQVAMQAGCDGLPDSVYRAAIDACNGSIRAVLQRVESGQLAAEAKAHLTAKLAAVPMDGRHGAERARLQAELEAVDRAIGME